MGETANRLQDAKKKTNADDVGLDEARHWRRETLRVCGTFAVRRPAEIVEGLRPVDRRAVEVVTVDCDGRPTCSSNRAR